MEKVDLNLGQQIRELQDKAVRYDNLKQQVNELEPDLLLLKQMIDKIISRVAPTARTRAGSAIDWAEMVEQFYEQIKHGAHVDGDFVQQKQPDWSAQQIHYLLTKLQQMPDVLKRQNGRKITLYIQKEV